MQKNDDNDQDLGDLLDVPLVLGVNYLASPSFGPSGSWRSFLDKDLATPETLERLRKLRDEE